MYNKVNSKEIEKRQNDVVRPIYSIIFVATLIFLSITYAYLAIGFNIGRRGIDPAHERRRRSNRISNIRNSNLPSNIESNSNSNSNVESNSNSNVESNSNSNSNIISNSNSNSNSNPIPPEPTPRPKPTPTPSNSNSNSNIDPVTPIEKPEWRIEFDNIVMDDNSVAPITKPKLDSKKTGVTYEVGLSAPGQYFSFDIDMVNRGSINAKIYDIIEEGLTNRQKQFLDYTVKYKNGSKIMRGDVLLAGQRKTVTVWLKFKDDLEKEDLPDTDVTLKLKYQVVYVEK